MRRAIFILIALMTAAAVSAQTGLGIEQIFSERYRDMKGASETILNHGNLNRVSLNLYHSITFTDHPELGAVIERLVARDGKRAVSKEVRYKAGHLYYGFYRLPSFNGNNRYILYLNGTLSGDNKIILLYLEGKDSENDVKKLLK